jgi:hypothetical protein
MSQLKVDTITDEAGTGSPSLPNGLTVGGVNYPTTGPLSNRNKIINGAMVIDQRNAGAAVTVPNDANFYTVDRWQVIESSSCVLQAQQVTDAPSNFTHSHRLTVTTAAGSIGASEIGQFTHRIEGFNSADLGFGTAAAASVTLSFWVKSSITGSFSGAFKNGAGNRSYPYSYTISAANTWEYKTVSIEGDTAGTWGTGNGIGVQVIFDFGSGANRRGTAGAWTNSNFDGVTGAAEIVTTSGATWQITGVQLEAGTVATPFEHRSFGQELALCMRYYYEISSEGSGGGFGNLNMFRVTDGSNTYFGVESHPVHMRAGPTITFESGMRVHLPGVVVEAGTFSANRATPARFNISVIPSATNNGAVRVAYPDGDGTAVRRIFLSAEL